MCEGRVKLGVLNGSELIGTIYLSLKSSIGWIMTTPTLIFWYRFMLISNYQTAIHRLCLEQFPNIPSPDGCGWVLEDEQLQVKWMELPCAPKAVLEFIHCNCQKSQCNKSSCSCLKDSLKCSDMCMCTDCLNFHHSDSLKKNYLLDDSDSECDTS